MIWTSSFMSNFSTLALRLGECVSVVLMSALCLVSVARATKRYLAIVFDQPWYQAVREDWRVESTGSTAQVLRGN
jgi:hypothetical protein